MANRHARISVKPEVMGGKPCIKGTRIPVDLILRYLGNGQSVEDILEAFPGLTVEDVRAAIEQRSSSTRLETDHGPGST
jgi:uncharacterized protein (DUF433 family)